MEFKELNYSYVRSMANCVREILSVLPFYSEDARKQEIQKFHPDNVWTFVHNNSRYNIIAIEDGEVVGFLSGTIDGNVLFVLWIGMKEKYRRSNHMETLWHMMEDWCRKNNIHKVWCDTNQLNIPAVTFMEKMGMTKCGDLKNFWYGHDYFLWEKTLDGKPDGEL